MAVSADDWLVADSEDEDAFPQLHPIYGSGTSAMNPSVAPDNLVSPEIIQTATFTPDQLRTPERGRRSPSTFANGSLFTPPGRMDSTIDDFTSVAPTSTTQSEMPPPPRPRPRPRPRVVIKKLATSNRDTVPSAPSSHISDTSVSATKRTNDSIQPATATSLAASEVVDDIYSSFDIAERAKMRSRKSQKAKESIPPSNQTNEVIELTSDEEDELILKPSKRQKKQGNPVSPPSVPTKPRPKPRLKIKRTAVFPGNSPSSEVVRQSPRVPLAQDTSSSQFPPSTLPTVPPSTPPQARELTPLSSSPMIVRKRKRTRPSVAVDDDEMNIVGGDPAGASPPFAEPPPFFAPSSSSVPTDSGIEIPPVESLSTRGKKKQALSKKGTQAKTRNNGRKGKKAEVTSSIVEMAEEPTSINQEAIAQAMYQSSNFTRDSPSPVAKQSTTSRKVSEKKSMTEKGKSRMVDSNEDELTLPSNLNTLGMPPGSEGQTSKENLRADDCSPPKHRPHERTPASGFQARGLSVKPKLTPMSELIRRVNSQPNSPFPNATRTYSPFLKSSRTMLSKIVPLHLNRRTPPPPLPRPPPPKKSKKQLEMEERLRRSWPRQSRDGPALQMTKERHCERRG
ncbi:hypothetical protein JVU11DRAFT_4138 [Chiua virens]|nr:hypothetical protein JVU11DRAFT_4138 [Chiua virens]